MKNSLLTLLTVFLFSFKASAADPVDFEVMLEDSHGWDAVPSGVLLFNDYSDGFDHYWKAYVNQVGNLVAKKPDIDFDKNSALVVSYAHKNESMTMKVKGVTLDAPERKLFVEVELCYRGGMSGQSIIQPIQVLKIPVQRLDYVPIPKITFTKAAPGKAC